MPALTALTFDPEIAYLYASRPTELGTVWEEQYGDKGIRRWVFIYNDSGAAFAEGNVIMRKAGTEEYKGLKTSATVSRTRLLGVAQFAIANGYCGFVLQKGIGEVLADGSVTADSPIVSDTAGDATDMTAGVEHCVFATALETDAGATLVTCAIDCPG